MTLRAALLSGRFRESSDVCLSVVPAQGLLVLAEAIARSEPDAAMLGMQAARERFVAACASRGAAGIRVRDSRPVARRRRVQLQELRARWRAVRRGSRH